MDDTSIWFDVRSIGGGEIVGHLQVFRGTKLDASWPLAELQPARIARAAATAAKGVKTCYEPPFVVAADLPYEGAPFAQPVTARLADPGEAAAALAGWDAELAAAGI